MLLRNMAKRVNPTVIGLFFLGSLILGIGTAIYVGSVKLFKQQVTMVTYFAESVNGLSVGSPVKFKGVPVGRVSDIQIRFNPETSASSIPVYMEIDQERLQNEFGLMLDISDQQILLEQVRSGLRAKLQLASLISGQLFVELDFIEDPDKNLPEFSHSELDYPEIPSAPSALSQLGKETSDLFTELSSIEFRQLGNEITELVSLLREKAENTDIERATRQIGETAGAVKDFLESEDIGQTIEHMQRTLRSLEQTSEKTGLAVGELKSEFNGVNGDLRDTLRGLRDLTGDLNQIIEPGSPVRGELEQILNNLERLSGSIANFSEYLERHPDALLKGRKLPKP